MQVKDKSDKKKDLLVRLERWPEVDSEQKLTRTSLTTQVREKLFKTNVLAYIADKFCETSAALAAGLPVAVGRQLDNDERSGPLIAHFARHAPTDQAVPAPGPAVAPGTRAPWTLLRDFYHITISV